MNFNQILKNVLVLPEYVGRKTKTTAIMDKRTWKVSFCPGLRVVLFKNSHCEPVNFPDCIQVKQTAPAPLDVGRLGWGKAFLFCKAFDQSLFY